MPTRSRRIAATPEQIWAVVSDANHLPRWWPGITRVEDVTGEHFTEVIPTRRGRPMRLDFRIVESDAPRRLTWTQDLVGTPFERLLTAWTTTLSLDPDGDGCVVTLAERQQLRGSFRAGALLQRRPARRRLQAALDGLAALF